MKIEICDACGSRDKVYRCKKCNKVFCRNCFFKFEWGSFADDKHNACLTALDEEIMEKIDGTK